MPDGSVTSHLRTQEKLLRTGGRTSKVLQEVLADLKIFIKLENPGIAYPYVTNIYMGLPANKFVPHNDYLFPRAVFLSSLVFTISNNSPHDVVL